MHVDDHSLAAEYPAVATGFQLRSSASPELVQSMPTEQLRASFLIERIFGDQLTWTFTDLDRLAVGGVSPRSAVALENVKQTGSDFFLARREMGVINVGGPGSVRVDGTDYPLSNLDCLYISLGSRDVSFNVAGPDGIGGEPPKFFLMSCPAHARYPTTLLRKSECKPIDLGSQATANQRRIYQLIHAGGINSCQLVMGFTELAEGSVWNTMPPHTHSRRSEIYLYFDLQENIVSHFLGQPDQTRHVFVRNEQAVLSPWWSIHCGCGTSAYRFIWAMAGENKTFDDMDKLTLSDLR
jgi:4-deoxy-L-threo-5-hexosulose-uronate ketol-isomerase